VRRDRLAYRRRMTRRAWAFAIAVALGAALLGLLEAFWGVNATHRQGPHWVEALLFVTTSLFLVFRRVSPLGCMAAITAVSAVEFALAGSPEGQGVATAAMVAAYSVARYRPRRSWWGLVLVAVFWVAWAGFDPMNTRPAQYAQSGVWMMEIVIPWLVGALVRSQAQNLEQRRVSREQRSARAVAEERNRIARELHDVIGHSVSVMTVQASAVRRRLTPDQAVEREALETVERVGREALGEMRRMVGVLREAGLDPDREPPPGLSQVSGLVDKVRATGLPVELTISGDPRPLPGGLDLTAYRLLQEGLTNTMRHAAEPAHAEVGITYGEGALELSVRDDARTTEPGVEAGHGLLGLRERVAVYGGELVARPRLGGGFELLATLPLDAPA
jgi:signal transduction histidine kinase